MVKDRAEFIYKKYKNEKYFHIININLENIYRLNLNLHFKLFHIIKELRCIIDKVIYDTLYDKYKIKVKYFRYNNDIILFIHDINIFEEIYSFIKKYINDEDILIFHLNKDISTEIFNISSNIIIINENGQITITKKYGYLDKKIIKKFTIENFYDEYNEYKSKKTDPYTGVVKLKEGADGVNYEMFEKNLKHISESVCKRIRKETYFFKPFVEIDIPKPPYVNSQIKEARKQGAIRVLSIASIKDVITQKLIYKSILNYCEKKFHNLKEDPSYGYRINRSAPMAVKYIYSEISNNGYMYVLDADIKKFFDEIPHYKLLERCENFFGKENKLLLSMIKRFISVDKVKKIYPYGEYKKVNIKNNKKIRKGIPQGGVLSGLLANIYMYEFDKFVINELYTKYDNNIKYVRYADDFLILSKNKKLLRYVYEDIKLYMDNLELTIHELGPINSKTKIIDLSDKCNQLEKINFLGFEIDSHNIRIKKDNVEKFKNNFKTDLEKYILKLENKNLYPVLDRRLYHPHKTLEKVIYFTRYKVYGNLAFEMNTCNGEIKASEFLICKKCGGKKNYRGWLTYFSLITDIEQLKEIDIWIRKQIYKEFYRSTKKFTNGKPIRLKKAMLKKMNVPSLEKFYYNIKNLNFKNKKVCECNELQDEYNQSNNEHDIILYDMNSSFLSYLECNNISPLS